MADEEKVRTDIVIQGNVATWTMKLEGDVLGTYTGTFQFKCYLTPVETISAGRDYRSLLGPNPAFASENESFLAYSLSQLKYRIISAPPFWATDKNNGFNGDIPDTYIVQAVLEAATDAEVIYRSQLNQRKKDSIERAIKAAEKLLKKNDEEDAELQNEDQIKKD